MIAIYFALLGAVVGSFLNVMVIRHGSGISLGGRSFCDTCGTSLRWYNLIPVVSWVALRGRCTSCGARISAQYPVVELVTAVAFLGVGVAHLSPLQQAAALVVVSLLVAISVYDIQHTIIPNSWVYAFAASSLMFGWLVFAPRELNAVALFLAAGPIAALPLWALWLVSGGRWMGLGDVKLALGIGWLLGPHWGVVAVFGGFIIGAIVSVCILLPLPHIARLVSLHMGRLGVSPESFTMKSEVPFGPFLACSCFLFWLSQYVLAPPLFLPW